MNSIVITAPTNAELETFMPLARVRTLCLISHSRSDSILSDYRRAAYDDGMHEARASFLPQTVATTFRTPYGAAKNFGLEAQIVDLDGVRSAVRLPLGPIIDITSVAFSDESGAAVAALSAGFSLVSNKFLRWAPSFSWPTAAARPTFTVTYQAGFPDGHPKLAALRVAVGELIAVKWDAQGGNYVMPTSATRVFRSLRTSRTANPSATS